MSLWIQEEEIFMDSIESFKEYMADNYNCYYVVTNDEGILMFDCYMDLIDMNCLANELAEDLIMTMGGTIMTITLYKELGYGKEI